MNWEVFKQKRARLNDRATVTINGRGSLLLSAAAWHLLGSPTRVELLYAADERIVGLRASDSPTAFNVTSGRQVSTKSFVTYFGITERSQRWPAYLDGDVLCVDLKQPGFPVTSNARRAAQASR